MTLYQRPSELRQAFIANAVKYLGYTASADRNNMFGERLGMNGQPWDGMFIDYVAREIGLSLPALSYVPNGMGWFVETGRLYNRPQRGDIVFFATSTVSDFGSPHVGIVIDTSRHGIDGTFETVEGMVSSGLPRRLESNDGVYKRTRSQMDVIGFGRPLFKPTHTQQSVLNLSPEKLKDLPSVKPAQVRVGLRHKNVELVQLALNQLLGVRGLPKGHFDERTRLAFAKFQRSIGLPASLATGHATLASLRALGERSGIFSTPEVE